MSKVEPSAIPNVRTLVSLLNSIASRFTKLHVLRLRSVVTRWYACFVDKGQRKRTGDVAEKLGVGLLLATVVQGIFAEKLAAAAYGIGALALATAIFFIVLAIYLYKED